MISYIFEYLLLPFVSGMHTLPVVLDGVILHSLCSTGTRNIQSLQRSLDGPS